MKNLGLIALAALVVAACSSTPTAPPPQAQPIEITRADVRVLSDKIPAMGQSRFSLPSGKAASCDPVRCELKWIERSVPVIGLTRRDLPPDVNVQITLSAAHFGELTRVMDEAKEKKTLVSAPLSLGEVRCNASACTWTP